MFVCRYCQRHAALAGYTPAAAAAAVVAVASAAASTPSFISTHSRAAHSLAGTKIKIRPRGPPPPHITGELTQPGAKPAPNYVRLIRKILLNLHDPWHLANQVKALLNKDKYAEALLLTTEASKSHAVTVAWNHLIEHQMKDQRLHGALKLFSDMKKRGQTPNAQSYTVVFKGCAQSMHPKLAVSEATRIYLSMYTGPIKPNIIHLNAVLEVCARAGDLETLFSIVSTSDDAMRTPNNQTYTIILHTLRPEKSLIRPDPGKDEEGLELRRKQNVVAIERARGIWAECVERWKVGQIVMDEVLACAMGYVLLQGEYADADSVLGLVKDTMKVPRFDRDEEKTAPTAIAGDDDSAKGISDDQPSAQHQLQVRLDGQQGMAKITVDGFAVPGTRALSLILKSLEKTRKTSAASKYWDYVTKVVGITPDEMNYRDLVRVLRRGHASNKMIEYLSVMPAEARTKDIFYLALKTCLRDQLNSSAFANACRTMKLMQASVQTPETQSLMVFVSVILSKSEFLEKLFKKDPTRARKLYNQQIMVGLEYLWELYRVLANSFSYPESGSVSLLHEWKQSRDARISANQLARRIVGVIDVLHQQGVADEMQTKHLRTRRNILSRQIQRFQDRYKAMEQLRLREAEALRPSLAAPETAEEGGSESSLSP